MRRYILIRVGQAALALWALVTVVFILEELSGSDAALALLPSDAKPAEIERLREELGLSRPVFVRYFVFPGDVLTGDFGVLGLGQAYEQPVILMVLERLPYTLAFIVLILGLSSVAAMLYGALLEMGKGAWAQGVRIVALVGWSAPLFVVSLLLLWLAVHLGMESVAFGSWWRLLGPGIAVCFHATALMQLANRPPAPASGLDWRTVWRRSARRVARIHHAHFTLIAGYLLIWLVLSGSIFGHSHIGGLAWIPGYFPPVVATATLAVGTLYIAVHLLVDVGAAWVSQRRGRLDDVAAHETAATPEPAADTAAATARQGGLTALFRRRRRYAPALILLLLLLIPMLFAGLISPHDPNQSELDNAFLPPFWVDGEYGEGSTKYLLGTDKLGRDILSRLIHGVGRTLRNAVFPIFCAGLLGIAVGAASGRRGGWVAAAASLLENVLVYLPAAFVMGLLAPVVGLGPGPLFIAVVLLLYPHYAGRARAAAVEARARGTRALPNALQSAIVPTTTGIGLVIILTTTTNFLGMGVPRPNAELGLMVAGGRELVVSAWWVLLFPALAIILVMLSVNLLGDWLRDRLDPKQRQV